jgi:tripartite-type tricarboxylate transporter receptor subunit TctC
MRQQILSFIFAAMLADVAAAQTYPTRPITVISGFAPGGPTDVVMRMLAEPMRVSLGQPIIIENVVGASGSLAVGRAVRATPDGYTLNIGHWSTHVLNGAIYALPYDLLTDLEPVALLPSNPMIIVSRRDIPANDLKELVAWAKTNPNGISVATGGPGSGTHVSGIYFQKLTGARVTFVPYRGAAPALQDLMSGQIDIFIDQVSNSLPQIRNGSIKAYGVTASSRVSSAPEIPTVDEVGFPGFYLSIWYGLWAPKGTPQTVIAKLSSAVADALADTSVRRHFNGLGLDMPAPEQRGPDALRARQKAEIEKWWPILKAANIKVE